LGQARRLTQAIKPCFLMSPPAVSQYVPPGMHFDVVIFDEASQIGAADAINCIYRGNALILAGDNKQLTPASLARVLDASRERPPGPGGARRSGLGLRPCEDGRAVRQPHPALALPIPA